MQRDFESQTSLAEQKLQLKAFTLSRKGERNLFVRQQDDFIPLS